MLQKSRAIALHFIRYKESSIIARFFTEELGQQSFVINGIRSAKSKSAPGLFQPLQLVDIIQYADERKDLHRLKDIQLAYPQMGIPLHPVKTAVAIFLAEFISKILKDAQPNRVLFQMLWDWIPAFDKKAEAFEQDHIVLIWNMLEPLGIQPQDIPGFLLHRNVTDLDADMLHFFQQWMKGETNVFRQLTNARRQWFLDRLLEYIQHHLEGTGTFQSLSVLREIFR